MNLKNYLDFYELLKSDDSSREERRSFGLKNVELKNKPKEQLIKWTDKHIQKLKKPFMSTKVNSYLYGISLAIVILAFVFGLFSGFGLLSYNGSEPVNVIFFMAMVIALPLITIILTLYSMLRANSSSAILIHISPAFWMEKILSFFPNKLKSEMKSSDLELNINPLIVNWLVIKRSQMMALSFSIGLLFALLLIVATKDIAFAWSTTLSISAEAFHNMLNTMSFPWKNIFPNAVPSLELVQNSQYYRLGDHLSESMIDNASLLGQWWKFLALSTLFYAIFLRFIIFVLSSFGLKKAIVKSFMMLDGAKKLLNDMNEAIVSTNSKDKENYFVSKNIEYEQSISLLESSYDTVLGWAISSEKLIVINDSNKITSANLFEVGGSNSFAQDNEVLNKSKSNVLLYVKAWEPPTMDFMDFLELLVEKVNKVVVMPIGTANDYVVKEKDLNVWARKLSTLKSEKVWLKQDSKKVLNAQ